jgi:hypothetical protein
MRSDTCSLALVVALVAVAASFVGAGEAPAWAPDLLARSDVGALAPAAFRARLRIDVPPARARSLELEVWRSGEERTLVRFLDPRERGKYLLRRDAVLWFLAPAARKPVRLSPSYRLRGSATLDDVLGLRYARDYGIESLEEITDAAGPLVAFELVARRPGLPYPRIRYVVRRAAARPVRAEYRLPSGKAASVVEFAEWATAGRRPYASRVVIRDELRGGAATEIRVLEIEERPVPAGLFDLDDATERKRLDAERP